jgi:hypothetical protein
LILTVVLEIFAAVGAVKLPVAASLFHEAINSYTQKESASATDPNVNLDGSPL